MSSGLKKLCRTGASFGLRLIRNSVRPHCSAAVMSGKEKHSGELFRALYIGAGRNREFLINRLFAEVEVVKQQNSVHPLAGRRWAKRGGINADLIIVDLDLPYSLLYLNWESLRVPQWVRQKVILPPSKQAFIDGMSRNLRRKVFRYIRKYGYSYDLVNSEDACRKFYHEIYAPFVRARFNNEGVVVDEAFFLSECRMGYLLRLRRHGEPEPIGGAILQLVGAQLSLVWMGFSSNDASSAPTGASDVLYYFTVEHAYDRDCRVVDFGPSRPLLDDGVFRYKRMWGSGAYGSLFPTGDILLRPMNFCTAVANIMSHNFWITRDRGRLVGQLMVEGRSMGTETLQKIAQECGHGIETIRLVSHSGFAVALREVANRIPGIVLIDLSGSREPVLDLVRG